MIEKGSNNIGGIIEVVVRLVLSQNSIGILQFLGMWLSSLCGRLCGLIQFVCSRRGVVGNREESLGHPETRSSGKLILQMGRVE